MISLEEKIHAAAEAVRRLWDETPRAGIILGTGLGRMAESIDVDIAIDYEDIPYFAAATAVGHSGVLICGRMAGVPVLVLRGRVHLYEGVPAQVVTLPIRVMRALGAEMVVLSNASGGMNPAFRTGDICIVHEHIDLMSPGLLSRICVNENSPGEKGRAGGGYSKEMVQRALDIADRERVRAQAGVYVGMLGPNYETRAEYRFLHKIGGDVVGMSTVPEAITAAECGLDVLALSIVTNVATPDDPHVTDALEVLHDASRAEPAVRTIVQKLLSETF